MESDLAGIAIYNIKAKDLHDTGSKLDPQDPSVLIRIGGNEKRTDRCTLHTNFTVFNVCVIIRSGKWMQRRMLPFQSICIFNLIAPGLI